MYLGDIYHYKVINIKFTKKFPQLLKKIDIVK
jgi:hypothetical protein